MFSYSYLYASLQVEFAPPVGYQEPERQRKGSTHDADEVRELFFISQSLSLCSL